MPVATLAPFVVFASHATLVQNAAAFLSAHGLSSATASPSEIAARLEDSAKFLHWIAKPGENRAEAALRFRDALHGAKPARIDLHKIHLLLAGQQVYQPVSDPIEEAVRVLAEGLRLVVTPPPAGRRTSPVSADQWSEDIRSPGPMTAHRLALALRRLPRIEPSQRRAELWKLFFEVFFPLDARYRSLGAAIVKALELSELGERSLEVLEAFYAAVPATVPPHKRVRHLVLLANAAGCMGFPAVADGALTEAAGSLESAFAGLGRTSRQARVLLFDVEESIGRIGVTSLMTSQFERIIEMRLAEEHFPRLISFMARAGLGRTGLSLYQRIEEIARKRNGEDQWPILTALIWPLARLNLGKAGEQAINRLLSDSEFLVGMTRDPLVRRRSWERWDRDLEALQSVLKSSPDGVPSMIVEKRRKVQEALRPRPVKVKAPQKKPDESAVEGLLARVAAVGRLERKERLREYEKILVKAAKMGLGSEAAKIFRAVHGAASKKLLHEQRGYLLELMAGLYASVAWGPEAEGVADLLISSALRIEGGCYRQTTWTRTKVLVPLAESLPSAGLAEEAALGLYERIVSHVYDYDGESHKAVIRSLCRSGLGRRSVPLLRRLAGRNMFLASHILDAVDELQLGTAIFPLYRDIAGFRGDIHSPLSVMFKSTRRTVENLVRVLRAVQANGSEEALDIARQCRETLSAMGPVTLFESIEAESFPEVLADELFPLALTLFEKDLNASVQPPHRVQKLENALGRTWAPELARRGREILARAKNDSEWETERAARFARIQHKLHVDAIAPAVEGLLRFASLKEGSENRILQEAAGKIANVNPMEAGRWLPGVAKKWISDPLRRDEFLVTVALGLPMNFNTLWKQMETILALAEAIEGAERRDRVLERASGLLNEWKSRPKNAESPMTHELLKRAEGLDVRIAKLKSA